MKLGVKIFCDAEFADYFKDKADFLEVMAIQGKDYSFLNDSLRRLYQLRQDPHCQQKFPENKRYPDWLFGNTSYFYYVLYKLIWFLSSTVIASLLYIL